MTIIEYNILKVSFNLGFVWFKLQKVGFRGSLLQSNGIISDKSWIRGFLTEISGSSSNGLTNFEKFGGIGNQG